MEWAVPKNWPLLDSIGGRAELVFSDGTRVPVSCELALYREISVEGGPLGPRFYGRVWDTNDPFLAIRYLGKECILEIQGRRLSMSITDRRGVIAHGTGLVEGFPGLQG